jgi:hypothetical protein
MFHSKLFPDCHAEEARGGGGALRRPSPAAHLWSLLLMAADTPRHPAAAQTAPTAPAQQNIGLLDLDAADGWWQCVTSQIPYTPELAAACRLPDP